MTSTIRVLAIFTLAAASLVGCSTAPPTKEAQSEILRDGTTALQDWGKQDPGVETLASKSYGYAMFPEVTKGGLVFGGAHGRGVVYERGQHVGYADLTEGSFGLQVGGQTYSELIVFENKGALDRFKQNRVDFSANASAVIAKTGVATNARFVDGVAVVIRPITGAMAEAAVGGQQLKYFPK
jgi:lipid-binding SYLF domain-containing protein